MKIKNFISMVVMTVLVSVASAQFDQDKAKELQTEAAQIKTELLQKDASMASFFDKSAGYVIFPTVGKGGLVVGGAYGKGVAYENGMYIGTAELKQLDLGLQAGAKAYTEIIFFETEKAFNKFKNNEFELSAEVSAVAITKGVAKKARFENGVAVFIHHKGGLMAEATIGGQKLNFHPENM
ncbi:YSC84-related protein [Aquimarina sp. W85]|uniref:lipid-binding SYLF domain-containing protein n=1 Tax=Aquimarina rhodophyticola TaxID=3342246 RepID=UPI00366AB21C